METNEHNTKEELIKENVVTDETPQEEVTEETTTELSNEEKLQQEVERLNDQVYRLSAEISNIQKRNAKERQDAAKYRSKSLAQNLLNVIDNLERSIASPSGLMTAETETQRLPARIPTAPVQPSVSASRVGSLHDRRVA